VVKWGLCETLGEKKEWGGDGLGISVGTEGESRKLADQERCRVFNFERAKRGKNELIKSLT